MKRIIGVRFKRLGKIYFFDPKWLEVKKGDKVSNETVSKNGYQLSNDGSVYTPPIPVITFTTNGGGTLDGITEQQLTKYEQLKVPTPIANQH